MVETSNPGRALEAARLSRPSLIILEQRPGAADALEVCNALRRSGDAGAADIPIIVVADAADLDGGKAAGVTDWLIRPFSSAYARTASRLGCFARPAGGRERRCLRTKSSGWRRCIALASSIRRASSASTG